MEQTTTPSPASAAAPVDERPMAICTECRQPFPAQRGVPRNTCGRECQRARTERLHGAAAVALAAETGDARYARLIAAGAAYARRLEARGPLTPEFIAGVLPKYSDRDMEIFNLLMTGDYSYLAAGNALGISRQAIAKRAAAFYYLLRQQKCVLCEKPYQPLRRDQKFCPTCLALSDAERDQKAMSMQSGAEIVSPTMNRCVACGLYKAKKDGGALPSGYCQSCRKIAQAEARAAGQAQVGGGAKRLRRTGVQSLVPAPLVSATESGVSPFTGRAPRPLPLPPTRLSILVNEQRKVAA